MKYLLVLLIALVLVSCGQVDSESENTEDSVVTNKSTATVVAGVDLDVLMEQAETAFATSEAAGFAWSVTADRLREARQAKVAGELETAIAKAQEAIKLAELSIAQGQAEINLWQARVPN